MARISESLAGRLGITVLATNAVLLPVLYLGLDRIVTRSEQDAHVTEMRTYARLVADQIEMADSEYSDEQIRAVLENVLISGDAIFAELELGGRNVRAELGPAGSSGRFSGDDFAFGTGDDETYNLSIPVHRGPETGTLRFGFDERYVMGEIRRTRVLILQALGAFFLISTLLAVYFGTRLAQPFKELQRASRRVASGELDATLVATSTITEFRALTDDLEVMRANLVSVGQRLQKEMRERDMAEKQRRRLEERLVERRRLETVGTLAAGIAHEFNNILVPIQLYTELAIEDVGADSPVRDDLLRVQTAARRAKRIVSDILVLTREPGPGVARVVNVVEVVTEVVRLQEQIARPGIRLVHEIASDCPPVRGEAVMLHQVIFNLCANANQAMPDGNGTLTLTVGPAHDAVLAQTDLTPGPYVDICVRDTGHGIGESVRPRIFEPFFTTRAVGRGTGLGLFVVHGMVASMGGAVVVDSEPGVGTAFHVLLRVAEPDDAGESPSGVKEEAM